MILTNAIPWVKAIGVDEKKLFMLQDYTMRVGNYLTQTSFKAIRVSLILL